MDHQKRIDELKAEITRLAGGQEVLWGIERLPPAVAVAFLEHVIRVEQAALEASGDSKTPPTH